MKVCVCVQVALFLSLGCGASSAPENITPSSPIVDLVRVDSTRDSRVFVGAGVRVTIVPVVGNDDLNVLMEMRVDGPYKETVWPATYTLKDEGPSMFPKYEEQYVSRHHGKAFRILTIPAAGEGEAAAVVSDSYASAHNRMPVKRSKEMVSTANAQSVVKRYLEQRASGHMESIQRWPRKKAEGFYLAEAKKNTELLHQTCKTSLRYTIDMTMSDEVLKSGPGIDRIASVLKQLCSEFPDIAADLAKITELRWTHDGKPGLTREGDILRWAPVSDADEVKATAREVFDMTQRVAKSANGTYFYVDATNNTAYFGKAQTLRRHRVLNRGNLDYEFRGFHLGLQLFSDVGRSMIRTRAPTWTLTCGRAEHPLTELTRSERDAFLSNVSLSNEYQFDREVFALARDDRGIYYYVDQRIAEKGAKDYRVYIGRKGAAKKTLLKDVVDDSEGLIFETAGGELRLRIDRRNSQIQHVFWSKRKKKRTELTILDPNENGELIFHELGAYEGTALGTICSAL